MLAACADGPKEFRYGQATSYLGFDPVGGLYNPSLAGCTVAEGDRTARWDELGRQVAWTDAYDETVVSWDGPCMTRVDEVSVYGSSDTVSFFCDDQGWPVEWVKTWGDEARYGRWVNSYEGRLLVQAVDPDEGVTLAYTWTGDRLASRAKDAAWPTTYTWNADGWIVEEFDTPETIAYAYDEAGRPSSRTDRFGTKVWDYAGDDARWPNQSTFTSEDGEITETALDYDCP